VFHLTHLLLTVFPEDVAEPTLERQILEVVEHVHGQVVR
jgi:hypothetical protein